MTGLYNVLEKVREIEQTPDGSLTEKERDIFDRGLVRVLKEIHDEIDETTFDAYGWSHDMTEEETLERIVALNKDRAEEEARREVRWLRPEFQNPDYGKTPTVKKVQEKLDVVEPAVTKGTTTLPAKLPERIAAVRDVLDDLGGVAEVRTIARMFKGRKGPAVRDALNALVALGLAESADDLYALTGNRSSSRAA